MDELNIDNILIPEEAESLFDSGIDTASQIEEPSEPKEGEQKKNNKETTEIVDVDQLFTSESESVGSEDNNQEEQEDAPFESNGTSPDFYSSIAKAFKEEGIFPDLDDSEYSKVKTPEDFRNLIEKKIQDSLDERQKRIDQALNLGVEPTAIKQYEGTLNYLDSINDEVLREESQDSEKLRKQLIFQDYINRGFSKERATREVQRSIDGGNDIEDAKEALLSNKEFFNKQYKDLINQAEAEDIRQEEQRKEQAKQLKASILEDSKVFGDLVVDKPTRQKIFDSISKPIYKDPETGEFYTAVGKYQLENNTEFLKNVGLIYTLTDGFKNLDGLIKGKVKKEVSKGLRELEHTINNTSRNNDGSLRYIGGVEEDPESFIGKGITLDV